MAAGDGFFIPYEWDAQNAFIDIFKINGLMHICIVVRDDDGYNEIQVVRPDGVVKHKADLTGRGVAHIFGVVAEPSRDSQTCKLACLTFPRDKPFSTKRTCYMHDTGIAVDWAQVAG